MSGADVGEGPWGPKLGETRDKSVSSLAEMKIFERGTEPLNLTLRLQEQWIPEKRGCPRESNAEGTKVSQASAGHRSPRNGLTQHVTPS